LSANPLSLQTITKKMITHESSLDLFTGQINYVLNSYKPHGLNIGAFRNVIMGGLGGSGIGATIAKTWFSSSFPVPIEAINDYHLPQYADKHTLVILNSYSGNTEETLNMYAEAIDKSCTVLIIASGGKLLELAKENNHHYNVLETGYQPRMTIGYGLSFLLLTLGELIGEDLKSDLEEVVSHFEENREGQKASAQRIFNFFKSSLDKKFVILADQAFAPVGLRFCQQVNENAKLEAFWHPVPECNHNVLESYVGRLQTNFIMLYSDLNQRVAARFDFMISHLEVDNNKVLPLFVPEYTLLSVFDMIYRLDWVSVMMANELHAPLMEVPVITNLKEYLADLEIIDEEE
jgi:glucose/mannose-6-phosphate isomerase